MKKLLAAFILIPLMLISAQTKEENVEKLLSETRLKDQMQGMSEGLEKGAAQMGASQLPEIAEFNTALQSSFNPEDLYKGIKNEFVKNYDATAIKEAIKFYSSGLGKKTIAAEFADDEAVRQQKMQELMMKMQMGNIDNDKLQAVNEYLKSMDAESLQAEITGTIVPMLIRGINYALPVDKQTPFEQIEAQINQMGGMMKAQIAQQLIIQNMVKFESLSIDEINQLTAFNKTDAGKWYSSTGFTAAKKIISKSADQFIKLVKK